MHPVHRHAPSHHSPFRTAPRRHLPLRYPASHRYFAGFSLLDIVIATAIALILFGIAIPSVTHAVSRVRSASAQTAIVGTLFDALRTATVLGQEVVVCPAPGAQCAGGEDWSRGWIAFVDLDGNRLRSPNEPLLRRERALSRDVRLQGTVGRPRIVYQPNGSNAGSNLSFTLCDRRGAAYAVGLVLSNGGRLRTARPAADAAVTCAAAL